MIWRGLRRENEPMKQEAPVGDYSESDMEKKKYTKKENESRTSSS